MRYEKKQTERDQVDRASHGRVSRIRPGARLRVRGPDRQPIIGVAVLTRVVDDKVDAALVPTREHGRRWFFTRGHDEFCVIEEL